jgi:hypothetical protein
MTDPESAALELLRVMPEDVAESLRLNRENQPLVTRIFADWIRGKHRELDLRTLQAATRYLQAGGEAWRAMADAKLARHRALRLEKSLAEEDELQDARHETGLLAERDQQEEIRLRALRRAEVKARRKVRIAHLEMALEATKAPPSDPIDVWQAYLNAFRRGVTGSQDFLSRTEEWLGEYGTMRRSLVAPEDPKREEKLESIDAFVGELRSLRDRMLRDAWSLAAEKTRR